MNSTPVIPVLGENALALFLIYSIPLFALAWLLANSIRWALQKYLQNQYQGLNLSLDESPDGEAEQADIIAKQLPNIWSFSSTLYFFAAPFLFYWQTYGLTSLGFPLVVIAAFGQLMTLGAAYSAGRKFEGNLSMSLFIVWAILVYGFINPWISPL